MTPERWKRVDELLETALDYPPGERASFLDRVCGGDPDMRREIETLLAADAEPGLIDRPVWSAASDLMEPAPALEPGTALGPYRIDRLVGPVAQKRPERVLFRRGQRHDLVGDVLDLDEAPVPAEVEAEAAVVGGGAPAVERVDDLRMVDPLVVMPPAELAIEPQPAVLARVPALRHRLTSDGRARCSRGKPPLPRS